MSPVTHIFDIDGTLVHFHTNTWLPGAKEILLALHARGDKIVFMTGRGEQDAGTEWSIGMTCVTIFAELQMLGVKYEAVFGCPSPRIFHDDSPVHLNPRVQNQSWL